MSGAEEDHSTAVTGDGRSVADRLQAVASVAQSIATCREPEALFRRLAGDLQRAVRFDFLALAFVDVKRGVVDRQQVLEIANMMLAARPDTPIQESPVGYVVEAQRPLVVADTAAETRWPEVMDIVRADGIASFCLLPLTTARRRLGTLAFGRRDVAAYDAGDIALLGEIAKIVALAVENARNFARLQAMRRQVVAERDHLRILLDVTNALVSTRNLDELIAVVSRSLHRVLPHELAALSLHQEPDSRDLVVQAATWRSSHGLPLDGTRLPIANSPSGRAFSARRTQVFGAVELEAEFAASADPMRRAGLHALGCVPLIVNDRVLGTLDVATATSEAFTPEAVARFEEVARQVAMAVANGMAFQEITELRDRLAKERLYLESEIRAEHGFEDIVGDSPALRRVLQQVEIVAPTDSTVLLLGETGTGKEVLARAIHDRSARNKRTFVKINCAAIPSGLLESELFGHEKGAFTGAIAQKIGRFEVANGGTLFLDEIGEIPLELQPKLLRVLQEQEFERIGGTRTVKVDVRLIAATNRALERMVEEHRFRDDLYYRLNVFPIRVPPLRERSQDIPSLVRYFVHRLARPMNRRVEVIAADTMEALCRYPWPGNVRELANLVERAIILSPGRTLEVPLDELEPRRPAGERADEAAGTLESVERAHVLRALQEANWILGGPRGAAARLAMKRTTLQSLMKRLGITRPG